MKLTEIAFSPKDITRGIDLVRQMNSLELIGVANNSGMARDEFWKKYDAGEFTR